MTTAKVSNLDQKHRKCQKIFLQKLFLHLKIKASEINFLFFMLKYREKIHNLQFIFR